MDSPVFSHDIIYIVSDITAGVFLIVLIMSLSLQTARRRGLPHLLAAAFFVLAGIFIRLFAGTMKDPADGLECRRGAYIISPAVSDAIWILSFAFIMIGISAAVTYAVFINRHDSKRNFRIRAAETAVLTVAGAVLYVITENINVFTAVILLHFGLCGLDLYRHCPERACREFKRASLFAMITFAFALAFDHVRLTGLGLAVMLMILGEQYRYHIGEELAADKEALAKNRLQLLAGQISHHYIYNSLQSISGLCDADPAEAKAALNAFSDYLRGNLESLTEEGWIPFTQELEHTRAYLELEKAAGNSSFVVGYDLGVTDFMLPPLVLEPLVENAVKHGAAGGEGTTLITVSTRETDSEICIEVTDRTEGCGGNEAPKTAKNRQGIKKKSVGLENVRTRLAMQCGGRLETGSSAGYARAAVYIPKDNL